MVQVSSVMGDLAHARLQSVGSGTGGNDAVWRRAEPRPTHTPTATRKPTRKKGNCKTCFGKSCLGRCWF
jgi:hypothetical protein